MMYLLSFLLVLLVYVLMTYRQMNALLKQGKTGCDTFGKASVLHHVCWRLVSNQIPLRRKAGFIAGCFAPGFTTHPTLKSRVCKFLAINLLKASDWCNSVAKSLSYVRGYVTRKSLIGCFQGHSPRFPEYPLRPFERTWAWRDVVRAAQELKYEGKRMVRDLIEVYNTSPAHDRFCGCMMCELDRQADEDVRLADIEDEMADQYADEVFHCSVCGNTMRNDQEPLCKACEEYYGNLIATRVPEEPPTVQDYLPPGVTQEEWDAAEDDYLTEPEDVWPQNLPMFYDEDDPDSQYSRETALLLRLADEAAELNEEPARDKELSRLRIKADIRREAFRKLCHEWGCVPSQDHDPRVRAKGRKSNRRYSYRRHLIK